MSINSDASVVVDATTVTAAVAYVPGMTAETQSGAVFVDAHGVMLAEGASSEEDNNIPMADVMAARGPAAFDAERDAPFGIRRMSRETLNPLEAAAISAAGGDPNAAQRELDAKAIEGEIDASRDAEDRAWWERCCIAWWRGVRQLGVVLKKNVVIAARRPVQTCAVILMPLFFVLILLIGVVLVPDQAEPAQTYVNRTFDMSNTINIMIDVASGRTPTIPGAGQDPTPGGGSGVDGDQATILGLSELLYSPLPVLPLDAYIGLQNIIAERVPPSVVKTLKKANDADLINGVLGNFLELGTLHFAVATPDAKKEAMAARLVKHINKTTLLFDSVYHGSVWNDEDAALRYIEEQSDMGRKTLALVVVDEISANPPSIKYRLRMNYSFIPSTKSLVNRYAVRLDTSYIRYWSSGFLSVQQAVDSWGFRADIKDAKKQTNSNAAGVQNAIEDLINAATDPSIKFNGRNLSQIDGDLRRISRQLAEAIENATIAADSLFNGTNATGLNGTNGTSGLRFAFTFNDIASAVAAGIASVPQDQLSNETAVRIAITDSVAAIGVPRNIAAQLADEVADDLVAATKDLQSFVGPAVTNALNQSGILNTTLGRQLTTVLEDEAAIAVAGQFVSTLLIAQSEQNVTLGSVHSLFREELLDANILNVTASAAKNPAVAAAATLFATLTGGKEVVWASPMPTPEYAVNVFLAIAGFLLGQLTVMATLYPFGVLVKSLVEEKEMQLRELMKIAGLQPWVNTAGWVITFFVLFFVSALIVTTYITTALFSRTSFTLLFAHIFSFYVSNISLALMLSTFFTRSRLASILSPVVLFCMLCPRYIFFAPGIEDTDLVWARYLAAFLAPTAFAMGTDVFGQYEGANMGMQWVDITTKSGNLPEFTVGSSFLMLYVDTILYLFLAWYFDNVLPSAFGTPRSPWFCVTPGWWCPRWADKRNFHCCLACVDDEAQIDDDNAHGPAPEREHHTRRHVHFTGRCWTMRGSPEAEAEETEGSNASSSNSRVETLSPELYERAPVRIRKLRKVYGRAFGCNTQPKVAVEGLDLDLVSGNITCLLGHNGAGKSTTIKMMCGLSVPTDGDVEMWGRSARYSMDSVRQTTGIGWCPQHSCLFPHLTVGEHIELFAAIKGVPCGQVERDVVAMLRDVGLFHKRRTLSGKLSGGMKRRLSVAIALIGNSKLVMLDEPTSGVDPVSRRDMWKLLRKHKKGRVMVLTTHYMDEAELLSDRVAILADGKLKCYGTSHFIKSLYTVGYSLTVTKTANAGAATPGRALLMAGAAGGARGASESIKTLVRRHVPSAQVMSDAASELAFHLPQSASPRFPELFRAIEAMTVAESGQDGIIDAFGLAMTNLESVFMKICDGERKDHLRQAGKAALAQHGVRGFLQRVLGGAGASSSAEDAGPEEALEGGGDSAYVSGDVVMEAENADGGGGGGGGDGGSEQIDPWSAERTENECARCSLRWEALFMKRVTNFRRDLKLIFCQLCLIPASVALVFLILTIRNNSAGPMIQLNTQLYDNAVQRVQEVVFSETPRHVPYLPADALVHATPFNANTSLALNDILLNQAYEHGSTGRWLAAISNDTFKFVAPVLDVPLLISGLSSGGVTFAALTQVLLAAATNQDPLAIAAVVLQVVAANPNAAQFVQFTPAPPAVPQVGIPVAQTVLFNATARHAWACMLSDLTEAESQHTVSVYNHPLPMTKYQVKARSTRLAFTAAWLLMIPFSLLPALYSAFIVQERTLQSKHQQFLSGADPIAFWLTSYAWDVLNNMVVVAVSLLVILCYQPESYTSTFEAFGCLTLILVCYGISSTALTYFYSIFFTNYSTAQVVITLLNFMSGFVLIMTHYSLLVATPETRAVDDVLVVFFRIFPSFCMGEAILNLGLISLVSAASEVLGRTAPQPFDYDVASRDLLIMTIEAVVFLALVIVIEIGSGNKTIVSCARILLMWLKRINPFPFVVRAYSSLADRVYNATCVPLKRALRRVLPCCLVDDAEDAAEAQRVMSLRAANARGGALELATPGSRSRASDADAAAAVLPEDTEVAKERERIERGDADSDALLLKKLRKEFPSTSKVGTSFTAVNDVSLGVPRSQCFGLLGANGAGKTTSLSMVTGKLPMTSGEVRVGGLSAAAARQDQRIGYCPQIDPLLPNMTCWETIAFYARLKGIPRAHLRSTVTRALDALGITQYKNVRASALSGGNMRKLSLGCAMIGGPNLLLLDEPSSGLDPAARRSMWKIVDGVRGDGVKAKRSIVLTTHSMEECEALCSRIGIMVVGKLQCLGSATRLKATYGQGWHVEVNVARVGADGRAPNLSDALSMLAVGLEEADAAAADEGGADDGGMFLPPPRPPTPRSVLPVPKDLWEIPLVDRIARIHDFMVTKFVGAECEEEFDGRLQYHIPTKGAADEVGLVRNLSTLFTVMEKHKARLGIETYAVSQATLEQVFCIIVQRHTPN